MKTFIKILSFLSVISYSLINNLYSEEKIKIGLIVPLSGEYSLIGESILKSTRLAINKINDNNIEIFPRDTGSNPFQTLEVSKELHNLGINIIIGPVFNENVEQNLTKGFDRVFKSIFPIEDLNDKATLEYVSYNLEKPKFDVEECITRGLTYSAALKCTLRLVVYEIDQENNTKDIFSAKEQEVYMGEVPMMTNSGTFITN